MLSKMKTALDIYEDMPRYMKAYLNNYGWHFNKRLLDLALVDMRMRNNVTGKVDKVEPMSKDKVDETLARYGITIENNTLYDYVYVANMGKADFWKSTIEDEHHLARFVKDYIDDVDAPSDVTMRRWYATMVAKGEPIEWEDVL